MNVILNDIKWFLIGSGAAAYAIFSVDLIEPLSRAIERL